jgi:hypothetical protein
MDGSRHGSPGCGFVFWSSLVPGNARGANHPVSVQRKIGESTVHLKRLRLRTNFDSMIGSAAGYPDPAACPVLNG